MSPTSNKQEKKAAKAAKRERTSFAADTALEDVDLGIVIVSDETSPFHFSAISTPHKVENLDSIVDDDSGSEISLGVEKNPPPVARERKEMNLSLITNTCPWGCNAVDLSGKVLNAAEKTWLANAYLNNEMTVR